MFTEYYSMPVVEPFIKECIKQLSKQELEKLVLKAARKDKQFHDYLLVNYADKEYGEKDLFEQAKSDIALCATKSYKGFSRELRSAKYLAACNKRITEFSKVSRNKVLVLDLIMVVLEESISSSYASLGTCFTAYDYQISLLVKKAITLIEKKLHPDYRIEYVPRLNEWLTILHSASNHIDSIYAMPNSI